MHLLGKEVYEDVLTIQLSVLKRPFYHFKSKKVFQHFSLQLILDGYGDIVWYPSCYFNVVKSNPVDIWNRLNEIKKTKADWNGVFLVTKLCLSAPCSNATLGQFFSHMNLIKTDVGSHLSLQSLNSFQAFSSKASDRSCSSPHSAQVV